jgi:endonuclease/exonuclease/phosphatase family metal-dependent hydrolase
MTLRVATWNVHEGSTSSSAEQFEAWEYLTELDLDIVALQEVPFDTSVDSQVVSAICEHTGLQFSSVLPLHPSSYGHQASGLAIIARYPLSLRTSRHFSADGLTLRVDGRDEAMHEKAVTRAVCSTPTGDIVLFNLHLFPFTKMAIKASDVRFDGLWADLKDELSTRGDAPAIVFGDFNTPERQLAMDPSAGYSRVVGDRVTHEGFASDDIFISGHLQVRRTELFENPSDHLLCFAELAESKPSSSG